MFTVAILQQSLHMGGNQEPVSYYGFLPVGQCSMCFIRSAGATK